MNFKYKILMAALAAIILVAATFYSGFLIGYEYNDFRCKKAFMEHFEKQ